MKKFSTVIFAALILSALPALAGAGRGAAAGVGNGGQSDYQRAQDKNPGLSDCEIVLLLIQLGSDAVYTDEVESVANDCQIAL